MGVSNRRPLGRSRAAANLILAVLLALGSVLSPFAPTGPATPALASVDAGSADDVVGQTLNGDITQPDFTHRGSNDSPNPLALNSPAGVALDTTNHRLFVVDKGNSRVLVYNLSITNTLTDRRADNVLGQADFRSGSTNRGSTAAANTLDSPDSQALAYDDAGNRLFVADTWNNRVLVYDVASITDGEAAVAVLGQSNFTSVNGNQGGGAAAGTLYRPYGLAYDSASNRLFVADRINNRVLVYDVASITNGENALLVLGQAAFNTNGSNQGGLSASSLSSPTGITLDTSGNRLFVADQSNHRVLVYDTASLSSGDSATRVLGQADVTSGSSNRGGSAAANTLFNPYAVAYDSSGNRLFVSDTSNNRVLVYDANPINNGENAVAVLGQADFTSGSANRGGSVAANTVSGPYGTHYDPTGNRLFVADQSNHRVLVYDVASITDGEDAVDLVGQLDPSGNAIFTKNSADYNQTNARGLSSPYFSALDTVNHRLFVAESGNHRVLVFNLSSTDALTDRLADNVLGQADLISGAANRGGSVAANTLYAPLGLAYDSSGNRLFVADQGSSRVLVYDVAEINPGENAVAVLGQANFTSASANRGGSVAANSLWSPAGLAYDSSGNRLFVADGTNSRVLAYDVASITNGENAVAVLGQANFTSSGSNRGGSAAVNTLKYPFGVGYDSSRSRLFVADRSNNRVLVHDVASVTNGEDAVAVLGQADFTTASANRGGSAAANTLNSPYGVGYDSSRSRLFVADTSNNRVLVHDVDSITNGEDAVAVLGQADFTSVSSNRGGSVAANTLYNPQDSMYDSTRNRLLVADQANNRVVIYNDTVSSTTTLASSVNPSASGQSVTFTATVTGAGGPPTGTVTFKDGATTLGTGSLSSGAATYGTSALAVGSHAITAEYGGDGTFSASTSSVLTQTVNKTSTSTTLASSVNPSASGQSVTFTATVSGAGGTPTGTVTFKDGATTLGTGSLSSGTATYATSALAVGSHSITAEYGGDSNFLASTSSALSQTVNGASTTTSLASSANPSTFALAVTFTAGVSSGSGTPTGSVIFKDGTTTLGTGSLSSGTATYSTSSLSAGSHSITAEYGGTSDFAASTSTALSQTVNKAATTTTLGSSTNPSASGQSVTFTSSVSSGAGTPTGSVIFKDGTTTLGTGSLSSGTATYSTSSLSAGSHSITAEYGGDSNFSASTSSALSQVVSPSFSAASWPETFTPYTFSDGSPILDPARDESPGYADVSSGVDDGVGTLPSVYTASDGTNLFFRFRMRSNPADASHGGFESTAYSVAIGVNGTQVAVVGLNGKSPSTDYVYVTNAGGSSVEQVYSTPFTGAQAGARAVSDGAGAYFVDFQMPISRITAMVPSVTASTPVQFFFGTSQAANLSVINKDFVPGSSVSFTGMAVTRLQGLTSTTTTLGSSTNPSTSGQSVTFTATVAGSGGTPTGTVTFKDGSAILGTGTLSNGTATYSTSGLSVGSHSITALYSGDSAFGTSTSSALSQTVIPATSGTTTTLASSPNPSVPGWSVIFTATVASTAGTPAGSVTFKDGSTTLGTATLSAGKASYTASGLSTGNHNITAQYGGDTNFDSSTSAVLVQGVAEPRWLPLGSGMDTKAGIRALAFDRSGNLYAGGFFTTAGGVSARNIAKWDGAAWSALGLGVGGGFDYVQALAFDSSGNLYAGGFFTTAGGVTVNNIAKWNGTSWSALGAGVGGSVLGLAFDASGNLYAGGFFITAGDVSARYIAKWDGKQWSALGSGTKGNTSALAFDRSGNLYASVYVFKAAEIVKWNGASWSVVGSPISAPTAMAFDRSGNLYAGGVFTTVSGVPANRVAKWDGSQWSALGQGVGVGLELVRDLVLDGSGNLYVGGDFITAGGVSVNRIAKWDGKQWSALGSGMNSLVYALALDGTGKLYAGGFFTKSGSRTVNKVAVYGPEVETTTTLTSSPNPSQYGQTVVLTATVSAPAGTPVGWVTFGYTFYFGKSTLGRVALSGGQAVLNTGWSWNQGSYSITAWYEGASPFNASASAPLAQVVPMTPALGLEASAKSVSGPNPPETGTPSAYAITLKAYNPGSGDLEKLVVTATVPSGVTIKSVGSDMTFSGQTVTWQYTGFQGEGDPTTLEIGETVSASFQVEVTPSAGQAGQNITLMSSAAGSGANPATGDGLTAAAGPVTVGPVAVARGTLAGGVTDFLDGSALSQAEVKVYDSKNNLAATAKTGAGGAYSIANLAEDSYKVAASKPNYLQSSAEVEVAGGWTSTLDIALAPLAGSLTGAVTDAASGQGLAAAMVEVRNADGSFSRTDNSNNAGRYAFGDIPAGVPLTVTVTHPDYDAGDGSTMPATPKWQGVSTTAKAYTADLRLYPKKGTLLGLVTDWNTGASLSGVRVSAYDAQENLVTQATTGSDGSYILPDLAPAAYGLRFLREPEYQPAAAKVTVRPNQPATMDASLAPRPGTVYGTAWGDKEKLAGASVALLDSLGMTVASATTNSAGEYQLPGVASGTYTVTASAPYYGEVAGSRAGLTLAPAGSVEKVLHLESIPGSLAGVVADARSGAVLTGATIQLYDSQSNLVGRASTDSQGSFTLGRVARGEYKLLATKPNYREGALSAKVGAGEALSMTVLLNPLPGSVSGQVADAATLQVLSGASVDLLDASGVAQASALSDGAGKFGLSGVSPGSYTAAGGHPDYDTGSQGQASLTLAPGGLAERDLRLSPKASAIGGRVASATTGEALASARVMAYDQSNNLAGSVTTDASGLYTVTNLAQGPYTLSVDGSAAGYLPATASVRVGPNRTIAQDLALAPRAGSLSGALTDAASSQPIAGAQIVLIYPNGNTASTRTNAEGEYAFTEVTAQMAVTVTAEAIPPFYLQGAGYTTGATVPAGGSATANLRLHPGPGSISGTVADALTGAPLAGVTVQVYDANGNRVGQGITDSQGGLSLKRVPAGTYSLLADKANYHPGSVTRRLQGGESLQVKILLAPRPGSIVGKVVDSASLAAMAGARVSLVDANGLVQATTLSEATGAYAFSGVVPGSYTVAAGHGDYDTGEQGRAALALAPGGLSERHLRLDPKPSAITGRAASATTGQAVASARIMAYDANGNLAATVATDASGAFTITNLAQGAFTLSVDGSAAGYLLSTVSVTLKPAQSLVQNLALAPRAGSLSGTLSNAASGQPIAGAQVKLAYPNGSMAYGRTSAGGEYAFTEVTAQVAVTVTALEARPYYLQTADSTATGTVPAGGASTANLRLQPGPGSVTGVAASALGPVSGATLQLYDSKGNLVARTTTGADGAYTLAGLPPGTYTLTFSKAGYLGSSYAARVEPGATASLALAPTPLAGSISGTVKTSSTLRPLARAAISLEDSGGSILATTLSDATGKYAFAGVTPGAYRVTAQHPDYQTGSKGTASGVLYPEGSLALNLSLDPRPATITGRVASSTTGQPVPGAAVRVYQANGDLLGTATADASGNYTVANVPEAADPYTLEWTAPSYLPATNRVAISSGQRAVQNTALVPVEGSLSGKVTDAITGKALQRATVEVRNSSGDILATSKTDRSGRYLVVGLPSQASLAVSATALNYRTIASSSATVPFVLSSSVSPAQRRAGDLSGTADLQLQPNPGSITGQATDSQTGAPLPGATVQLYDANNNLVATATTDASGAYTFSEVTVGDYTISMVGSGYLAASQAISVDPGQAGAKDVPLPPQAGSISGAVTEGTTGKPLSGATVVLTYPAGQAQSTTSQANGAFAFAGVSAGTSVVGASHPDYTAGNGSSSNVILLSGQTAKADLALYPRPGEVSGTVLEPTTGQPVAGATIQVRDSSGNLLATYTTDAQGRYYVRNLPPGSYTISFSRAGYLDASSTLRVSSNQAVEASIVAVPMAQSISGAVTNSSTGQAIAGARVELLESSGGLASAALTGSAGSFVFASVSLGTYTLRASHLEYDSGSGASATVTLAAGQAANRDLRLDPKKGAIQVTVLDQATGQPLAGASITISNTQGLIATLTTDAQGQAAKDGLVAGAYQVTASRSGLAARSATATVEPNRKALASLRLGYLVRATVLETETNQPVVGAMVLLVGSGGALAGAGTTGAGGLLQLDVTATATYTITVSAPEFDQVGQSTASFSLSAGSPSVSATLYLARQKTPHLTLAMTRFAPRVLPFEVRGMSYAGEPIYYGLSYGNYGTTRATGVVITETLPISTTLLGPAGWTRVDARTYTYNVGILGVGERGTVQFVVGREPALAPASAITNTVTIGDDGRNGRDLRPASAVTDIFRLHAIYLPLLSRAWAAGW